MRNKLTWITLILTLFILNDTIAQQYWIFGRVIREDTKQPVVGASVHLTDKASMVTTDQNGYFRIESHSVVGEIQVQHIAYEHRTINYRLPFRDSLIVMLKTLSNELDEVIVSTGYQDLNKATSTGAFEKIDGDLLNRNISSDLLARLNNTTTGTYFHTARDRFNNIGRPITRELSIHGISTLKEGSGTSEGPLIILDNFPYEGDINSINPNEIESITLLKDAAAASIWGAKAGNGVLVIKSKQAVYGAHTKIRFSSDFMLHSKPDLYQHRTISPSDYIEVERELFKNGFYDFYEMDPAKPVLSPVVELLILGRDKKINPNSMEEQIASFQNQDVRDDISKYLYRNATLQRYNLEMIGGGQNSSFVISAGYDHTNALIRELTNDRLTFRLANTNRLFDNLEIQNSIRWMGSNDHTPVSYFVYSDNGFPIPYQSLVDENGNSVNIPYLYRTPFIDNVAKEGQLLDWRYNPIEELKNGGRDQRRDELLIQTALKYPVLSWLNLNFQYQWNKSWNQEDNLYNMKSFYARNLINRGTEIQNGKAVYHFPYGAIMDAYQSNQQAHSGRFQADLNKDWNRVKMSGIFGVDLQETVNTDGGYIRYGFDPDLLTAAQNLNFNSTYPVYADLGSPERIPFNTKESNLLTRRFVSFFSNASISFYDRYVLTGSARRDASNLFGVDTNNKWSPLWSIGGAWLLHSEPFMQADWLNSLKLRASYGYSGNVNSSMSGKTVLVYYNSRVPEVDYPAGAVQYPPNPLLRWEKVGNFNIGVDFSIFNAKFWGSVDVYKKRTKDLIHRYPLDPTSGFASMDMNVAGTKSLGDDVQLNYRTIGESWNWQTNLLFSYNNNWITDSYVDYSGPSLLVRTGSARAASKGMQVFPAYSYRWGGLDPIDGTPVGYLNGEHSKEYRQIMSAQTKEEDLVYHGSARPLLFGAFRNTFNRGRWSLSANISYRFLYYFRRSGLDYSKMFYNGDGHADYYSRWQKPGDEKDTHVPAMQYPVTYGNTFYQYAEVLMERGDHIRLEDLRVAYSKKVFNKDLNIYIQGNNLGILWRANKLKLDPHVEGGIPLPRSYAVGLNINL